MSMKFKLFKRFRFIDINIQLFNEKVNGFSQLQVKNRLFAQLAIYDFQHFNIQFSHFKTLVSNFMSNNAEKPS